MNDHRIVKRRGHMSPQGKGQNGKLLDGEYITDSVTVQATGPEGEVIGEGTGISEKDALRAALANAEEIKAESEKRVKAAQKARQALIEEIRG